MRKTHSSIATVIAKGFLIPVNVISFKWTSKFFREQLSTAFIRLKDRMPELDGSKYFGKKGTES
jgi:hypothetical protein